MRTNGGEYQEEMKFLIIFDRLSAYQSEQK